MLRALFLIICALLALPAGAQAQTQVYKVTTSSGQLNGGCASSAPLPMDTGPTFTAAYGVCALTKKWLNGNLFAVTAQSRSVTIRAINGYPDVRTLAALMGISPTNGVGGLPMSTWYDQSGNGYNCTQSTTANQPDVWLVNGKVFIAFDGMLVDQLTGSNADKYCTMPSGVSTNNQETSVYIAEQNNIGGNEYGYSDNYGSSPFTLGPSGSSGSSWDAEWSSGHGIVWLGEDWTSFTALYTSLVPESQSLVMGFIFGSSNVTITQNEESGTTGSAVGSGSAAGGYIGAIPFYSINSGFYGRMQAFLVSGGTTFTSTQQTTERNSLYARFGIFKSTQYSVLIDGASYDSGVGSLVGGVNGYGWDAQLHDMVPYGIRWGNTAISGATLEDLTTNFSTSQAGFYSGSYSKNLYVLSGAAAGNSISAGDTGAEAYSALESLITAVETAGWTAGNIYVETIFNTSTQQADYNAALADNDLGINVVGPFSGGLPQCPVNAVIGTGESTNATYYNQSSPYSPHPTVVGYNAFMKCFWPQVIQQGIGP